MRSFIQAWCLLISELGYSGRVFTEEDIDVLEGDLDAVRQYMQESEISSSLNLLSPSGERVSIDMLDQVNDFIVMLSRDGACLARIELQKKQQEEEEEEEKEKKEEETYLLPERERREKDGDEKEQETTTTTTKKKKQSFQRLLLSQSDRHRKDIAAAAATTTSNRNTTTSWSSTARYI
ncbi:hypothetical protein CSUI_011413 [Cystoisospora suis]|uniref:Uncharacterized protein n=1 Tax=Cystoisospora suis TaxID=483139 RepID=A0A2C6K920_9APIC|nr:hypothetical protein CSUI_011413 [Cystoisospora suis]